MLPLATVASAPGIESAITTKTVWRQFVVFNLLSFHFVFAFVFCFVFGLFACVCRCSWHCLGPATWDLRPKSNSFCGARWNLLIMTGYNILAKVGERRRNIGDRRGPWGGRPIDSYVKNSISSNRFIADLLFIRFNFIAHFRTTCWIQCNWKSQQNR